MKHTIVGDYQVRCKEENMRKVTGHLQVISGINDRMQIKVFACTFLSTVPSMHEAKRHVGFISSWQDIPGV